MGISDLNPLDLLDFAIDPVGFLIEMTLKDILFNNFAEIVLMPILFGCMIYIGKKKQGAFGGYINLTCSVLLYNIFAADYTIPFLSNPFIFRAVSLIYLSLVVIYLCFCYKKGGIILALTSGICLMITRYYILIMEKPIRGGGVVSYGGNGFAFFVYAILFIVWIGWIIYTLMRLIFSQVD